MSAPTPHEPSTARADAGLLDGEQERRGVVTLGDGPSQEGEIDAPAARRLWGSVAGMLACIVLTYLVPALAPAQPWSADEEYVPFWNLVGREWMGQGARVEEKDRDQEALEALARETVAPAPPARVRPPIAAPVKSPAAVETYPARAVPAGDDAAPKVSLEGVEALEPMFHELALMELGRRTDPIRVSHWGDSVLGNDGITAAIRTRMQAVFGSAGHGFHLLAQNNPSYRHKGIRVRYAGDWQRCYVINKCKKDRRYGLGGLTVWSSGGAETRFEFGNEGDTGGSLRDRFEVWFATHPRGGDLQIKVDGEIVERVSTRREQPGEDRVVIDVPAGAHEYRVRAVGGGVARAFGVVMEHAGPGVVWDGIALIGAFTSRFSPKYMDAAHFGRQLGDRDVDLAVVMFGGNDLLGFRAARYRPVFRSMLDMIREAAPDRACLVMSVIDHAERKGARIVSKPEVATMVQIQREEALDAGCAFFDAYAAMGGEGSMGRWNRAKPRLASGDLAHLTHHGHQVMGELFTAAFLRAYQEFRVDVTGQPLATPRAHPSGHAREVVTPTAAGE